MFLADGLLDFSLVFGEFGGDWWGIFSLFFSKRCGPTATEEKEKKTLEMADFRYHTVVI